MSFGSTDYYIQHTEKETTVHTTTANRTVCTVKIKKELATENDKPNKTFMSHSTCNSQQNANINHTTFFHC